MAFTHWQNQSKATMTQPQSRRSASLAPRKQRSIDRSSPLTFERTPGNNGAPNGRSRKASPQTAPQVQISSGLRSTSRSARAPTRSVSSTTSIGQPRRRSSSAQRYSTVHVNTSQQHPPRQNRSSHRHHPQPTGNKIQTSRGYYTDGSDAGSVASAPSLKAFREREFREPSSSRSGSGKKFYREDSPASRKSTQGDTPQKHIKTARKVIEGELLGRPP